MLVDTNGHTIAEPAAVTPALLRPYADILADLAKPLPQDCLSSYTKKGQKITYVHWAVVLEVFAKYAPGSSFEPVEVYEVCGQLMVKLKLTVRAQEGEFVQYALGWDEDTESDAFGGPIPKAWATAIRRAGMMFGLERRLWDDKESHPLANLQAHWRGETPPSPAPVAATPKRTSPAKKAPESPMTDAERAQIWHDLYAVFSDTRQEFGLVPGRMARWLKREYGKQDTDWTERLLTIEQLQELIAMFQNGQVSEKLLTWLRTPMEATQPPTETAA